jgi:DNA-binding CsgD family transcriptional regulator
MALAPPLGDDPGMAVAVQRPHTARPVASDPVIVIDGRLDVRSLNRAAELLLDTTHDAVNGLPIPDELDTPGLRMLLAGWPARPEHVRLSGVRYRMTLVALPEGPSPRIIAMLAHDPDPTEGLQSTSPLSPRQLEVLGQLAAGTRCSAIAVALGISETTVRHHIRAILRALGVHSQLAAVAEARALGLV